MTILITGGNGALGKEFQNSHNQNSFKYFSSSEYDLTDFNQVKCLLFEYKPKSIIHLAALSGGMQLSRQRPYDVLVKNVEMATNIVEASIPLGIKRIGFALSGAGYGSNKSSNLAMESEFQTFPILEDDFPYGYAKRYLEILMRSANKQHNLEIYSFVINGIIGNSMNFEENKSIVVASLIKRIYEARKSEDPIVVWGDGTPQRQYTWAQDLVTAILWCQSNQIPSTVLNIGTNEVITVKKLALEICKNFEVDSARLIFDVTKGNGKLSQLTDNSKFVSLSGMKYMPFETALKKVCLSFASSNSISENFT